MTLRLGGQLFGLPTGDIRFTHSLTMVHPVPLSAAPVAAMVHVHGGSLSVVVDWQNHSYCVLVDEICDVVSNILELVKPYIEEPN